MQIEKAFLSTFLFDIEVPLVGSTLQVRWCLWLRKSVAPLRHAFSIVISNEQYFISFYLYGQPRAGLFMLQ
jgi:hypothetical protein